MYLFYERVTHRLGAFPHVKYSSVSTYTVFMYTVTELEISVHGVNYVIQDLPTAGFKGFNGS